LKRILTEPTLFIEGKGLNAIEMENMLKVIIASNQDWVFPASFNARRVAMFDVSDERMGDKEYFAKLAHQMKHGGLAAMLHDLLHFDLDGRHPRDDVPQTQALVDQKELSLSPADQWWLSLIASGVLPADNRVRGIPSRTTSEALFEHARHTVPRLKDTSDTMLGRELRKRGCVPFKLQGSIRGWQFPPLSDLRREWDRKMKASRHRWDGGNDWSEHGF
jgi:hypothetical protein